MQIIDGIIKNSDEISQVNATNQSQKTLSGSEFLNFLKNLDHNSTEDKTLNLSNFGEDIEQMMLSNLGKLLDKHDLSSLTAASSEAGEDAQILREIISDIGNIGRDLSSGQINFDEINRIVTDINIDEKNIIFGEVSDINEVSYDYSEDFSEKEIILKPELKSSENLPLLEERSSAGQILAEGKTSLNENSSENNRPIIEEISFKPESIMDEKLLIEEYEEKNEEIVEKIDENIEFSSEEFLNFNHEKIISNNPQKIFQASDDLNEGVSLEKPENISNISDLNYIISDKENSDLAEEPKELTEENNFAEIVEEFAEIRGSAEIRSKSDNFVKKNQNNYGKFSQANLDKYKIIDQFKVSLENISVNNNKIMIKLYPEELGQVEIELKFNNDIVNNVNIEVANNLTYNILQDEIVNIKSLLNNIGFGVSEGQLNLSLNQQQQNQSDNNKKNKAKNKIIDITRNVEKYIHQPNYYKNIDITV